MTDHSRLQRDILNFWFGDDPSELRPKWFKQSAEFDRQCARFADAIRDGRAGQFDHWATAAKGALALIVLLDQLSRNVFRGSAEAFAADPHAFAIARRAIADGFDTVLERALEEALDQADHLYISLDVDVCDPAYAPGTGTPEPGGLTSAEILRTVRRLAAEVGIVGMDVVEVAPTLIGSADITALVADRIVREALTGVALRRSAS